MKTIKLLVIFGLLSASNLIYGFDCSQNKCEFSKKPDETIKNCFKKEGIPKIDKDLVTKKNPNCAKAFLGNYCRAHSNLDDCKTIAALLEELESHANCTRFDCGKSGKEDQIIKCFQVMDITTKEYKFNADMITKTNPNCAKAYLNTYCKGQNTSNCEAVRNPQNSGSQTTAAAPKTEQLTEAQYKECEEAQKESETTVNRAFCSAYIKCMKDVTKKPKQCVVESTH